MNGDNLQPRGGSTRVCWLRRMLGALVIVVSLASSSQLAPAAESDAPLESGVPRHVVLTSGETHWRAKMTVPKEGRALSLVVCADTTLKLYLRHGQDFEGDFPREAHLTRTVPSCSMAIRLTPDGDVSLEPGDWFVAIVRDEREAVRPSRFELIALLDLADGSPTIVAGQSMRVSRTATGQLPPIRTYLPGGNRRLSLQFDGMPDEGMSFELRGPEGARRSGVCRRQLLLDATDHPSGVYRLSFLPAEAQEVPASLRVQVRLAGGATGEPVVESGPTLEAGSSLSFVLGGPGASAHRTVEIPPQVDAGGLVIEAFNDQDADIDIFVRRGRVAKRGDADADYLAVSSASRETLVVGGIKPLVPEPHYCRVQLIDSEKAAIVTIRCSRFEPKEGRGTWGASLPKPLRSGAWVRGRVESRRRGIRWYTVAVPVGARSMHAVLMGSTGPLDMLLLNREDGAIAHRAIGPRVDDRLDVVFERPPEEPRKYVLGVFSRDLHEPVVDYHIAVSFDNPPAPPKELKWPPLYVGTSPLTRCAAAAVELTVRGDSGGSGTCVTPAGLILTCRHVLETERKGGPIQRDNILVAFPSRLDAPPTQSFVARVRFDDESLDLALLEIVADIFGRKVDPRLRLPWIPMADSSTVGIGDPVHVLGYPTEGSERVRTPLILTKGNVAGLEARRKVPRWIKTDAWIGLGHSGGALVNDACQLIGVPAATLGSNGVLGLAIPTSVIPEAWRDLIKKEARR